MVDSPALPTGINLDATTGEISGTPTIISSFTTYTITATNTGGSATTTIDITVNDIIPSLVSYSPSSFTETKGTAMTAVSPSSSGGPVVSWSISPGLPTGLSIDASTGEISVLQRTFQFNNLHNYRNKLWWQCNNND